MVLQFFFLLEIDIRLLMVMNIIIKEQKINFNEYFRYIYFFIQGGERSSAG